MACEEQKSTTRDKVDCRDFLFSIQYAMCDLLLYRSIKKCISLIINQVSLIKVPVCYNFVTECLLVTVWTSLHLLLEIFCRSVSRDNLLVDLNGTATSSETSSVTDGVEGELSPAQCTSPTLGLLSWCYFSLIPMQLSPIFTWFVFDTNDEGFVTLVTFKINLGLKWFGFYAELQKVKQRVKLQPRARVNQA